MDPDPAAAVVLLRRQQAWGVQLAVHTVLLGLLDRGRLVRTTVGLEADLRFLRGTLEQAGPACSSTIAAGMHLAHRGLKLLAQHQVRAAVPQLRAALSALGEASLVHLELPGALRGAETRTGRMRGRP